MHRGCPQLHAFRSCIRPINAFMQIATMSDSFQAHQGLSDFCREGSHETSHGMKRLLQVSPALLHYGRSTAIGVVKVHLADSAVHRLMPTAGYQAPGHGTDVLRQGLLMQDPLVSLERPQQSHSHHGTLRALPRGGLPGTQVSSSSIIVMDMPVYFPIALAPLCPP
jgi:hypothetical protein